MVRSTIPVEWILPAEMAAAQPARHGRIAGRSATIKWTGPGHPSP